MIFYINDKQHEEFERNITDWHLGGPKKNGWTRTGPKRTKRLFRLVKYHVQQIDVDDALSKNKLETLRWHISFLQNHSNWFETNYYKEYLQPRYNVQKSIQRIKNFLELFEDIKHRGIKHAIWVADMQACGLGYFRFNGCHRSCCAKVLNIPTVPAFVFSVLEFSKNNTFQLLV